MSERRLTIAERYPVAGDVVTTLYPAFCEMYPPTLFNEQMRTVQVVSFFYDAEKRSCGLDFRRLPEDEDYDPAGGSWHTSGMPWLENGSYVSRADGESVVVKEAGE